MAVSVGVWVELGGVVLGGVVLGVEVLWVWLGGVVELPEPPMHPLTKTMATKRSAPKSLVFFIFITWIICPAVGRLEA